jgi:gamma-glutamyltranspeptidase / glutathione hydrolase
MPLPSVIALLIVCAMTMLSAQLPGDRPAGNARGTRSPVLARNGMIATSQPLASAAGVQVTIAGISGDDSRH